MYFKLLSLALIIFISGVNNARAELTQEELSTILHEMPLKDRIDFIRFHINNGYGLIENPAATFTRNSAQLSIDIYNYFVKYRKINDSEAIINLQKKICFPFGCIDMDDPGVHP